MGMKKWKVVDVENGVLDSSNELDLYTVVGRDRKKYGVEWIKVWKIIILYYNFFYVIYKYIYIMYFFVVFIKM